MDIIGRIDVEPLKIPGGSVNKPFASGSPRAEEDHGKTCEPEIEARELMEKLQGYIDRMNINLAFSTYGEKSKKTAIIVSEKETGKLIREIPPEELQQLHVKMEKLAGILFNGMI